MDILATLAENYQWKLSLLAALGIIVGSIVVGKLASLVPTIGEAVKLNQDTLAKRMEKPSYAANQKWNRKWAILFQFIIFLGILPFCIAPGLPSIGQLLIDIVVILMVYDFFYYLTHRFLSPDTRFSGGPPK
ncbi:MAG TPA: hypothetical protein PKD92_13905 [Novosphingobium sp.]|nr:hypothetical protein [Novosphingobium sp.]